VQIKAAFFFDGKNQPRFLWDTATGDAKLSDNHQYDSLLRLRATWSQVGSLRLHHV